VAAKKATKKVAKKVAKKATKKATKKVAKKSAKKVAKKVAKKAAKKVAKKASKKVAKKASKKVAKKAPPVHATAREELHLVTELPTSPHRVIADWLDSEAHTAFTGADASIDPVVGGKHSAWSGYIEGTLQVIEPQRLVMSWRTTEFTSTDPDSQVEVLASKSKIGTRLELIHTDLPEGGAEKYTAGWRDFYFVPMAARYR
jgi:activator of HSP90 ATPase